MNGIKNQVAEIKRLTKGPEHNFFGYYDLTAWNSDQKLHLCHKVKFANRLPVREDVAQLGMIDTVSLKFIALAQTTAWNFQQGAMLQWRPGYPNQVVYNVRQNDSYYSMVKNIETGSESIIEMPIANVSPNGRLGLSINFDRMFDFRPGYGYSGRADRFGDMDHPAEDGIFLVDMITGKGKMIISLDRVWEFLKEEASRVSKGKLLINHINFNTDGSRFVFLARNFSNAEGEWGTAVITANVDGSGLFLLNDYKYASHYHWKDRENLLIHAANRNGNQLYLLKDKTDQVEVIDEYFFLKDGHCSYSPDRNWILYDSYPDGDGYRNLYLYYVAQRKGILLASLYSYPPDIIDIRCDLHPRWVPTGKAITFDSTHENHRHIYWMELEEVMNRYFVCE